MMGFGDAMASSGPNATNLHVVQMMPWHPQTASSLASFKSTCECVCVCVCVNVSCGEIGAEEVALSVQLVGERAAGGRQFPPTRCRSSSHQLSH